MRRAISADGMKSGITKIEELINMKTPDSVNQINRACWVFSPWLSIYTLAGFCRKFIPEYEEHRANTSKLNRVNVEKIKNPS